MVNVPVYFFRRIDADGRESYFNLAEVQSFAVAPKGKVAMVTIALAGRTEAIVLQAVEATRFMAFVNDRAGII